MENIIINIGVLWLLYITLPLIIRFLLLVHYVVKDVISELVFRETEGSVLKKNMIKVLEFIVTAIVLIIIYILIKYS